MTDRDYLPIALNAINQKIKEMEHVECMKMFPNDDRLYDLHVVSLRLTQLHNCLRRLGYVKTFPSPIINNPFES